MFFMERTVEAIVELENSEGYFVSPDGTKYGQFMGVNLPKIADNDGNFSLDDGKRGVIRDVHYKSPDLPLHLGEHEFFSFAEYVAMGRPDRIKVKIITNYVPISDS